jgi:hypothetical protein
MVPVRYFVVKHGGQWRVEFDSVYRNGFLTQKEAVEDARISAREAALQNKKVEVLVQSEKGVWYTDWTEEDI